MRRTRGQRRPSLPRRADRLGLGAGLRLRSAARYDLRCGPCELPLGRSGGDLLRQQLGGLTLRALLCAQFKEYLERAEYIKGVIDGQQPAETAPANGATGEKTRPPGGGGDVRGPARTLSYPCPSWLHSTGAVRCWSQERAVLSA